MSASGVARRRGCATVEGGLSGSRRLSEAREAEAPSAIRSRAFHAAVLLAGTAFLLTDAFHGNVWFDESYSVAIANHSFADIWRIGAGDVHPVLFYWALHVLNLVFGQNVLVYRLFTVAGAVALACLGYTHLRRDFGARTGVLFSFFALFTPYVATMAVEVRMYSWATFAVTLCCVYAYRIASVLRRRGPIGICASAQGLRLWEGVPRRWWIVLFASGLASAYLHYFGAITAFVANALLLCFLLGRVVRLRRVGGGGGGALAVFLAGSVVQVALYTPWLLVLLQQAGVVSDSYWANIVFPTTYIELATYPVLTSQVSFALRGAYGEGWKIALDVLAVAAAAVAAAFALRAARTAAGACRVRRDALARDDADAASQDASSARPGKDARRMRCAPSEVAARWMRRAASWAVSDAVLPVLLALGVYVGVYGIAWAASFALDSLILYYRYLFVAIGPLLFACAGALARVRSRALVGAACAVLLGVSVVHQALSVMDSYDERNGEPLSCLEEQVEELVEEQGSAPLVASSDIGFQGVAAVALPSISQTYLDWQKGNWGLAYEAYAPVLTSKKSWELIFEDFHGRFIALGQAQGEGLPRDVADLAQKDGFSLIESQTFYRPYERTWFTVAVMDKA
ncbi:glycosyltransferase family 39 protein [Gordonibacter sp. An230]|uniref:glycosyltransferase family 39 protein n=1 Tax=Gordonibacter sp. An230 TaxID=1965592 RepID=UPI0013A63EA0|nr:glycosyltransferase family 39 protein [Gordonibacter sp. An230]